MLKAVVYDFDGTLTPNMLPIFAILEKCGLENGTQNPQFLEQVRTRAAADNLGLVESTIETILDIMRKGGVALTNDNLCLGAKERSYNPGVENFLSNLQNNNIKNFLLSSGAKAYLEETQIAPYFDKIYASTVAYDGDGRVTGIEYALNEPEKAIVLQKIAQDINGNPEDCNGIVYIGDGPTDVYAMDYTNAHGGHSIMVYLDENSLQQNRAADYNVLADYRPESELSKIIASLMATK